MIDVKTYRPTRAEFISDAAVHAAQRAGLEGSDVGDAAAVQTAAAVVHDHAVAQFAEHRATDSRSEQDALQQAKQQLAELSLMAGREKQCTVRDRP